MYTHTHTHASHSRSLTGSRHEVHGLSFVSDCQPFARTYAQTSMARCGQGFPRFPQLGKLRRFHEVPNHKRPVIPAPNLRVSKDLPPDASQKIRARRAQQLAELHRREEAPVPSFAQCPQGLRNSETIASRAQGLEFRFSWRSCQAESPNFHRF